MTAEDPVEFQLGGVNPGADEGADWIKLRRRAAIVPAAGPQYILVGEIRDFETAEIAIKAGLRATLCSRLCTPTAPGNHYPIDEYGY